MQRFKMHEYCTYILTNKANTVLYIGITSELEKRIWEHKNKAYDGFTSKFNIKTCLLRGVSMGT
jgi:putative endonuclease